MKMTRRLQEIHEEALLEFDKVSTALRDERLQCLKDRRFYSIAGAQWEGKLEDQFENKPKFEINKIHLSIIRIIDEYRNNRITVDFIPKHGEQSDSLADTCDGLYRSDEQDSTANEAYDNAFEEAVGGGFGAWRLIAKYEDDEDEENEYQRICFEPIYDADSSVYFDLNAKRQDKADATKCWVMTAMTPEAYESKFNDDVSSWPKLVHQHEYDWLTDDVVYIAEYYKKEEITKTIYVYQSIDGKEEKYTEEDFEDEPELRQQLESIGSTMIRQRKVKESRVHKYIMSGNSILEDLGYIAGKCIPIIPCYGKRWYIDNIERCMGHVRLCKDVQRIKNMQVSKLGEISALSAIEKPIFYPEQVDAHALRWAEDNIKNYPYMLIDPIYDLDGNMQVTGPIGYTKPPQVPQALAALLQLTEQDMKDLLGNQQQGEQIQPNTSGIAVELVQNRLDMQTAIYVSNFAKAMKRSGEVWLGMAKDLFVESGRKMKTVDREKKTGTVELMKPIINKDTGEIEYENDFSKAKMSISVSVGPSSQTKRASTVRALTGMMQVTQDPETLNVLSSTALMNMEGEGIDDIRKFFRKRLVRMGVITPTDDEKQEIQAEMEAQQQPSPEQEYMKAAAMEAAARAQKAQADTLLTAAKTEQTKADTVSTLAEIDQKEKQGAINAMKTMADMQNQQQQQRQNMLQNQENL